VSPGARRLLEGRASVAVALVVTAAYAVLAAGTTPFSWGADVVTALPIVVVGVAAVVRWPVHPVRAGELVSDGGGAGASRHPFRWWVVLVGAVVAWELVEYLARGSRGAHPTLSSMADAFDRHEAAKAVAFFAWLWLGAAIVQAGTPRRAASWRAAGGMGSS
jgi:hypothetical protein